MNRHRPWRRMALLTASIAAIAGAAQALPTGGAVVASTSPGTATINSTPTTLTVNQTAQRVVIDWSTFNIANGETVTFNQPNVSSIAFNRIGSLSATTINGALNANGAVFLFSPGGMIFGPNANVNVGSFLTSMGSFANGDISTNLSSTSLAFDMVATGPTQPAPTFNVQAGAQITANAGFVELIGPSITQNGTVTASDSITYLVSEGGGLNFTETPTELIYDSTNVRRVFGRGRISFTHGGVTAAGRNVRVITPAPVLEAGFHAVLNLSGTIEAGTLGPVGNSGYIILSTATNGAAAPVNDSTIAFDASAAQIIAPAGLQLAATDMTLGTVYTGGMFAEVWRNFTFAGPLVASEDIDIFGYSQGAITFNGDFSTAGRLQIQDQFASLNIQSGRTVFASGVDAEVGGPITVGANASLLSDAALQLHSDGLLTIAAGALVGTVAGDDLVTETWPVAFAAGDDTTGGIVLEAADIDLRGQVISLSSTGPGDVAMIIGGANAVLGGAADSVPGSYTLSDAEFQRITGGTVIVGASMNDGAGGADIEIRDLNLDAARLSRLLIGTEGHAINVTGALTSSGGVDVDLGELIVFYNPGNDNGAFDGIPSSITITGSLGTADRPLGLVRMIADGDILMGSSGFVQAVAGDPSFNPDALNNLPAPSPGHLFVSADGLQMAATGRIIQQNSGTALEDAGILVGAPTAAQTLIVNPDLIALANQLGAQFSFSVPPDATAPDFTQGPSVVSLHAEFLANGGQPAASGFEVASSPYLLPQGLSSQPDYRFNSCGAGGSGCIAPGGGEAQEAIRFESPVEVADSAGQQLDEGLALDTAESGGSVSEGQELVNSFLALPNDEDEEEKEKLSLPVTGAGNGDLWRASPEGAKP
jgi:filamentous hemagglutinin family protein